MLYIPKPLGLCALWVDQLPCTSPPLRYWVGIDPWDEGNEGLGIIFIWNQTVTSNNLSCEIL